MQPHDSQEELIRSLAEREEVSGVGDDSTTLGIQAELETLKNALRQSPPADSFAEESDCEKMVQAIEAIGRDPSFASRQEAAADHQPVVTTGATAEPLGMLGQYRLLAKLGEGGMGAVYKALHTRLDKVVALKLLTASRLQDPHSVTRFNREMRAVGKLHHQNIVAAHDAGEVDGTHYLVMELIDGIDLAALVKRHGVLPIGAACELIRQAALGLHHAHEHSLVHRDIKPSNLMLTHPRDAEDLPLVKVLDLGLALLEEAHLEAAVELTSTGQVMGTFEYMAPEQATDTHTVDKRADVYSLGASLYMLLTGQPPFSRHVYRSQIKLLMALTTREPAPVGNLRTDIQPELAVVVHRMLAKDPNERWATAREVALALGPFANVNEVRQVLENLGVPTLMLEAPVDVHGVTVIEANQSTQLYLPESPTQPLQAVPTATSAVVPLAAAVSPPRNSRLKRWLAGALLAVGLILAAAIYTITVKTGQGEIVIHSEVPVKVNLLMAGETLEPDGWTLQAGENRRRVVRRGQVEVELPEGLKGEYSVKADSVALHDGQRQIFKIEKIKSAPVKAVAGTQSQQPEHQKAALGPTADRPAERPAQPQSPSPTNQVAIDRERVAATLWQKWGGSGSVLLKSSGKTAYFLSTDALPEEPFECYELAGSLNHQISTRELQNFVGLPKLRGQILRSDLLDWSALPVLQQLRNVHYLFLHSSRLPTSALGQLDGLPYLRHLWISGKALNDEWSFLVHLPGVSQLWISDLQPTAADFQQLAQHPQLREVRFLAPIKLDVDEVAAFQRKNPRCRVIADGVEGQLVGVDTVREATRKLLKLGIQADLYSVHGNSLKPTPQEILDDPQVFNPMTFVLPKNVNPQDPVLKEFSSTPFSWLGADDLENADAVVAALPDDLSVLRIALSRSDLTDQGLAQLSRFKHLINLFIAGTRVTPNGIEIYKRAVPSCEVHSDFGISPAIQEGIRWTPPARRETLQNELERKIAREWLAKKESGRTAQIYRKDLRSLQSLDENSQIPAAPFCIERLNNGSQPVTADELKGLTRLSNLERLTITEPVLDNDTLNLLSQLPRIQVIELYGKTKTSQLALLKFCPALYGIALTDPEVDDNWECLSQLPQLQLLALKKKHATFADWVRWSQFPNLTEIVVQSSDQLDEATRVQIEGKSPACRRVIETGQIQYLGTNPVQAAMRTLLSKGCEISLQDFGEWQRETLTRPDDAEKLTPWLNVSGLKIPEAAVLGAQDLAWLRAFAGKYYPSLTSVMAPRTRLADELLAALNGQTWLGSIDLSGSQLTDAGLAQLTNATRLRKLVITGTAVTQRGIAALQSRLPECNVISDFGETDPLRVRDWCREAECYDLPELQKDRAAAESWLRIGGSIVQYSLHDATYQQIIPPEQQLTRYPFRLIHAWSGQSLKVSTEQLRAFQGVKNLESIALNGGTISRADVGMLSECHRLQTMYLVGSGLPTSALTQLAHLPYLSSLRIEGRDVDDNWNFATQLKHLRHLEVIGSELTQEHLAHLTGAEHLREVWFVDAKIRQMAEVSDFHRRNPFCRVIAGTGDEAVVIGADPVREAVRRLSQAGLEIANRGFSAGLKPTLAEQLADSRPFLVNSCTILRSTQPSEEDLKPFAQIKFITLNASGHTDADHIAGKLPKGMSVNDIDFSSSSLTDVGLQALSDVASEATVLRIISTKVTRQGVDAFLKQHPHILLFNDFYPLFAMNVVDSNAVSVDPQAVQDRREREFAEWWLSHRATGCAVQIYRKDIREDLIVQAGDKLPQAPFCVEKALINGPCGMTNDDFRRVVGLSNLQEVNLWSKQLDGGVMEHLAKVKTLRRLLVFETNVPTSSFTQLSNNPVFYELGGGNNPVDDNWSSLGQLPRLQSFAWMHCSVSAADWRRWAEFPQIGQICVTSVDAATRQLMKECEDRNPNCRRVVHLDSGVMRILGNDPTIGAVRTLVDRGCQLLVRDQKWNFTAMASPPQSAEITGEHYVDEITIPEGVQLSDQELAQLRKFSGRSYPGLRKVVAIKVSQADRLAAALDDQMWLMTLDLSNSDLSDEGLRKIRCAPLLEKLLVTGTQVTQIGITEFSKRFPACEISSDKGVVEAVSPRDQSHLRQSYDTDVLDRDRAAAELWQQRKGSPVVILKHNGRFRQILGNSTLPVIPFELRDAWCNDDLQMSDKDLEKFANLDNLYSISISGSLVTGAGIGQLKDCRRLIAMYLGGSSIPTSALSQLETIPRLQMLRIAGRNVDDKWEFARRLKPLRTLEILDYQPVAEDWRIWATMPHLREIWLWHAENIDPQLVAEMQKQNPSCRVLVGESVVRCIGDDPTRKAMAGLNQPGIFIDAVPIKPNYEQPVEKSLENTAVLIANAIRIQPQVDLDKVNMSDLGFFRHISAYDWQNADEFVKKLPRPLRAETINLRGSDLSDAGLETLVEVAVESSQVDVINTRVTREGIDKLLKALPHLKIISNFGTIENTR